MTAILGIDPTPFVLISQVVHSVVIHHQSSTLLKGGLNGFAGTVIFYMAGYLCVRLELRVELADSTPIPNFSVQLDTPALVDSGGHSHDGNRSMGRYIVPKESGTGVDTIASGIRKTDTTGVLKFKFLASQFGGKERIRAHLVDDTTKWDRLSLITRVKGLELLPGDINYSKLGGTCEHHGPGGAGSCAVPDNDHWGASDVIDSLTSIAEEWASQFPNEPGLFINDMSLPLGGGFDIFGQWKADLVPGRGHQSHREGRDVDIRTAFPNYRTGVNIRDAQGNLILDERGRPIGNQRFNRICRVHGSVPNIDGDLETHSEHYHLDF